MDYLFSSSIFHYLWSLCVCSLRYSRYCLIWSYLVEGQVPLSLKINIFSNIKYQTFTWGKQILWKVIKASQETLQYCMDNNNLKSFCHKIRHTRAKVTQPNALKERAIYIRFIFFTRNSEMNLQKKALRNRITVLDILIFWYKTAKNR